MYSYTSIAGAASRDGFDEPGAECDEGTLSDAVPHGSASATSHGPGAEAAESADLPEELLRIVTLLPPGDYTRERLCTQLNSAIADHAWGQVYGTVE